MRAERYFPSELVTSWISNSGQPPLSGNTGVIYETGPWTAPINGQYEITCVGGGGGGACYYGAGGGSGYVTVSTLTLSGSYNITIGSGGIRKTGPGGTGGSGGQTIFGNNLVVANGGLGGTYGFSTFGAGTGGNGGSGGGGVCNASNSRGAWGGGGGGFNGSNGGEAKYEGQYGSGSGGTGSLGVAWGKGTNPKIPPGGSGVGIYNYLAGFGVGSETLNSVMDYPYEGIYGYGKGNGGGFVFASFATARGGGGGGSGWSNDCGNGMPGMVVWKYLGP